MCPSSDNDSCIPQNKQPPTAFDIFQRGQLALQIYSTPKSQYKSIDEAEGNLRASEGKW